MGCVAAKVNIVVYEGGTFDQTFQWKSGDPAIAVDLTGYTAKFTIRAEMAGSSLVSATEASLPWEADADSGVYLDDADEGKYRMYVNDADAVALCADNVDIDGVYDIFLYSPAGEAVLKQYGKCAIKAAVTR
jgi:hypothetical protein